MNNLLQASHNAQQARTQELPSDILDKISGGCPGDGGGDGHDNLRVCLVENEVVIDEY